MMVDASAEMVYLLEVVERETPGVYAGAGKKRRKLVRVKCVRTIRPENRSRS